MGRDDETNREEMTTLFKGVARGAVAALPAVAGAVCDTFFEIFLALRKEEPLYLLCGCFRSPKQVPPHSL